MNEKYTKRLETCIRKVDYMLGELQGFPHATKGGMWLQNQNGHWTGGFWTGLLWIKSILNGEQKDRETAKEWALKLRCRMTDDTTHDLGFIFGPSCVFGHRLTGDGDFLPLIHAGSDNLRHQYVPQSGLIRAWGESGYEGISIVDTIMNLPIIWISCAMTGDKEGQDFALAVARRIQQYAVRSDDSTFHVVKWDRDFNISGGTHQGYSDTSCWSRGQAWALYGFANMYRYTAQREFLDTAVRTAEYFWTHLNDDHLPAWDFIFRNQDVPIDASAASVAASGMQLLASILRKEGEESAAEVWEARVDTILDAMTEKCLYRNLDRYGIIEKVTIDLPRNSGVGESSMYGDYYFAEALYRKLYRDDDKMLDMLY